MELFARPHGVKALDGGDADAADAVELRGLQVLDVVKLGELAAVVGRDELLEFFQGLVAEVAAVDEEEDAARASELDEAVNEVDGGVGLAAAGGHLDEGAAFVGGEPEFPLEADIGKGVIVAIAGSGAGHKPSKLSKF